MPIRHVELTEDQDRFVVEQVDRHGYLTADEVIRAGLRLLEERTRFRTEAIRSLERLAAPAIADLDAGLGIVLSDDSEIDAYIDEVGRRLDRESIENANHQ
jgi:putative addiction module CopG family antidote